MRSLLIIQILTIQVLLISAGYELLVEILSLSNPDGRCGNQNCGILCCDGRCPALRCDYYFLLCQKSAASPISYVRSVNPENCSSFTSNPVKESTKELNSFSSTIFNSSVIFTGDEWPSDGTQIHLEVDDFDSGSGNDEMIDRFVINATLSVGTNLTHALSGIFGFAEISVSLTLQCADNFYGPDCNRFCSGSCSCDPGLTGPYCSESINECDSAVCGKNQICEDGHLTFTCVCEAGYTGPNCTVDIDECADVNCNFGTCQERRGFFTCVCSPGYTGMFCDEEMDSYQVQITVDSGRNPNGMCADERCSNETCCDSTCPRARCDYFLQYCKTDIGSPVHERSIFQHDSCMAATTLPEYHSTNFFSFTPSQNTLTLFEREWPIEGIQVVVDLVDADSNSQSHELVDRFVIKITSLDQTSEFHMGIFGLADLNITIEVTDISGTFTSTATTPATFPPTATTPATFPPTATTLETFPPTATTPEAIPLTATTPETVPLTATDPSSQGTPENNKISTSLPFLVSVVLAFVVGIMMTGTIALCVCVCVMRRKSKLSQDSVHYSSQSGVLINETSTSQAQASNSREVADILSTQSVTLRNARVESNLNKYSKLKYASLGLKAADSQLTTQQKKDAPIAATNKTFDYTEYESPLPPSTMTKTEISADSPRETEVAYDYIPQDTAEEEYDYECPYWAPADKKSELLSQFRKLRIPSVTQKELEEKKLIGQGAFGQVYKGIWQHRVFGSEEIVEDEVAVKTMTEANSEDQVIKFLQEAAIMGQFDHPNIVKIMGIMAIEQQSKIIMEFMANGDLRSHLPTLKSRFTEKKELSSQLLYYSRQVASGMTYLSLKGYVHRDLAARNILVSEDDVCKIGDFGLSRDLQHEETYLAKKGGKIPVKWTAPEALEYRLYSTASDVWSFACVLYEIWSLGVKPYDQKKNSEVIVMISGGYRLPPPPGCPRAVYDIMIKCWNQDSELRPTSSEICSKLNLPEFRVLKWSGEDVSRYSEEARTVGAPLAKGEELFTELQNAYKT